jgi:hypothetical protein
MVRQCYTTGIHDGLTKAGGEHSDAKHDTDNGGSDVDDGEDFLGCEIAPDLALGREARHGLSKLGVLHRLH